MIAVSNFVPDALQNEIRNIIPSRFWQEFIPENFDWQDNLIIYHQYISLYEYVYGTNIKFKIGSKEFEYLNWIPSREGNVIFIESIENCCI